MNIILTLNNIFIYKNILFFMLCAKILTYFVHSSLFKQLVTTALKIGSLIIIHLEGINKVSVLSRLIM